MLATHVCHEPGCNACPFICGRADCECIVFHANHRNHDIRTFIQRLSSEHLPENLRQERQRIDATIDKLISALCWLRKGYYEHVWDESQKHRQFLALSKKLAFGEELQINEATGDILSKMLAQKPHPSALLAMTSINSGGQHLLAGLQRIKFGVSSLVESLNQVWSPDKYNKNVDTEFQFSTVSKGSDIRVVQKYKKAYLSSDDQNGLALLEPCLSTTTPSRVTFRMLGGFAEFGVCIKQLVEKHRYSGYPDEENHGMFSLNGSGELVCQNKQNQRVSFEFTEGDAVTLVFDPQACTLTYSLVGSEDRYVLQMDKEDVKPESLYLFVSLNGCSGGSGVALI